MLNDKLETLKKFANSRGEVIEKYKQRVATLEKELAAKDVAQNLVRCTF